MRRRGDGQDYRTLAMLATALFVAAGSLQFTGIPLTEAHSPARAAAPDVFHEPHHTRALPKNLFWLSREFRPGDPRLVDVVGAGDVMMGSHDQGLNPDIHPDSDTRSLIGDELVDVFARADISFVNLEGPLYDGREPTEKICGACYAFRVPTSYAKLLAGLHLSAVSLANNHSSDYGEAGLRSTLAALDANHIGYFGLDRSDARTADIAMKDGSHAAFVSFAPNPGTLDINDLDSEARLIRALKKTHRVVVVSFHGGAEGWEYAHVEAGHAFFKGEDRGDVLRFAHDAIDAGADIVIGQGPHVPRALEIYRGHLIAYSLGNFWTYGAIDTSHVRGDGPVLEAFLAPDGTIAGFAIHSTEQHDTGIPHLDPSEDAVRLMLDLTREDFPQTAATLETARRGATPGT